MTLTMHKEMTIYIAMNGAVKNMKFIATQYAIMIIALLLGMDMESHSIKKVIIQDYVAMNKNVVIMEKLTFLT